MAIVIKRAYVTYLGSNDYLIGTISLYLSLISGGAQYPFVVMTSPQIGDSEKEILRALSIRYIDVSVPNVSRQIQKFNDEHGFPHWNQTFAKLSMFNLIEYEKIIFLDSDMMILQNIDNLFQCDSFSAVAAGHAFPGHEKWVQLNSGLMVIQPETGLAERLISEIPTTVSNVIGDQDVIQAYQPIWPEKKQLHLSEGYNLFIDCVDYYLRHGILQKKDIYVIHFEGKKPWKRSKLSWCKYFALLMIKRKWKQILYLREYRNLIRRSRAIILHKGFQS